MDDPMEPPLPPVRKFIHADISGLLVEEMTVATTEVEGVGFKVVVVLTDAETNLSLICRMTSRVARQAAASLLNKADEVDVQNGTTLD